MHIINHTLQKFQQQYSLLLQEPVLGPLSTSHTACLANSCRKPHAHVAAYLPDLCLMLVLLLPLVLHVCACLLSRQQQQTLSKQSSGLAQPPLAAAASGSKEQQRHRVRSS